MNSVDLIHMKSGVYKCQDDIRNFKIRILLKKLIGPIPITCGPVNCAAEREDITVSWQQKIFSKKEFNIYSKRRNCTTDRLKEYHQIIKNTTEKPYRLFTFVHNDILGDEEQNVTTETKPQMSKLYEHMSKLTLDTDTKDAGKAKNVDEVNMETVEESTSYDIRKPLTSSIVKVYPENPHEYMIVMVDLGHVDVESQLFYHYEQMICIIKYDKVKKILAIFPDFTKNTNVPYVLQSEMDRKIYYYYTLEHVSNVKISKTQIEETIDLEKILETSVYRPVYNVEFECPAYDIYRVHIALEIVSAQNFGFAPMFVQYNVDLPNHWASIDSDTFGTTHACTVHGLEHIADYSHYFDIDLEYTVQGNEEDLPKCPTIYFQVISLDSWDRYKVEGLTYKCLPVYTPGKYRLELQCLTVPDNVHNERIRKYFLGDYGNINDLSWLSIPKGYKGNVLNKYGVPTISSGSVQIRLNVLSQLNAAGIYASVIPDAHQDGNRGDKTSLTKTVNNVIDAYQKAKDAMIQSRLKLTSDE